MTNQITILGRGKSLEKLNGFESEGSRVILINEFWKTPSNPCDYYKEPAISNFITGKEIILVGTPTVRDSFNLTHEIETDHNITDKFNTVWAKGSGTYRDNPPCSGWNAMPHECLDNYKYAHLSGKLKQTDVYPGVWSKGCVRGSLAYAILLAIDYFKVRKVNIFGLDFYEEDYLVPQSYNYETEKKQVTSMKNDFTLLFNFFSQIKFDIYTASSYNPQLENVKIF